MKVLIVAKTRRGSGACVGAITENGHSARLVASDSTHNDRAGLEYEVGDVWEVESQPDPHTVPPHVENLIVYRASRLRRTTKLRETIDRFMPPVTGGPEKLFEGLARPTAAGSLYVSEVAGLPSRSTMFWRPDQPLELDPNGKRIRYRYPGTHGGCSLTFVGFQEPLPTIPAGTLVRASLAHPWKPQDRPQDELRCFLQISGWFMDEENSAGTPGQELSQPRMPEAKAGLGSTDAERLTLAAHTLKSTFGFTSFQPLQAEAITRVLARRDSLVVMPTGGGKSLCYQLPALLLDGLTLVVTPLVALMHDQVRQLTKQNIPAACLNHTVAHRDWTAITDQVRHGSIKLLYLAPETMFRPEILLLLEQSRLACLAVDEAHCLSEWGHDFRPEYRQIPRLRDKFPKAACLALTATATERVRQDICQLLGIPSEGRFVAPFNRPNLFLAVRKRVKNGFSQIVPFVQAQEGHSGIIYCGMRKQADRVCAQLLDYGIPSVPYHAGMEDHARHENQAKFISGEVPLIVATVAFGMGINKPDVRFVIHAHLPRDLESYYQEIGRAGRDGLPAHCLLLYNWSDVFMHRHFIDQGAQMERQGRRERLSALTRFAETTGCRRVPLLNYFGERIAAGCHACDHCTDVLPACYEERPVPCPAPKRNQRPRQRPERIEPGSRTHAVVRMFSDGKNISEITAHFAVKSQTVFGHLERYAASGGNLNTQQILALSSLNQESRDRALAAFRKLGWTRLTPVHKELREAVTFDELRVLRLYLLVQARPETP